MLVAHFYSHFKVLKKPSYLEFHKYLVYLKQIQQLED